MNFPILDKTWIIEMGCSMVIEPSPKRQQRNTNSEVIIHCRFYHVCDCNITTRMSRRLTFVIVILRVWCLVVVSLQGNAFTFQCCITTFPRLEHIRKFHTNGNTICFCIWITIIVTGFKFTETFPSQLDCTSVILYATSFCWDNFRSIIAAAVLPRLCVINL